jgi:hypothetical protein
VLTFVEGDVPVEEPAPEWALTGEVLVSVVRLVRAMHEAARDFVPPEGAVWAWPPPPEYRGDLVCHNDVCRENVVFRAGRAVALIDFDFAGPATPAWEMAGVLRHWVMARPGDRVARARLACDTYGIGLSEVAPALLARMDWASRWSRRGRGRASRGSSRCGRRGCTSATARCARGSRST